MKSPLLIPALVVTLVNIGAAVTDVQPVPVRCALVAAVAFLIVGWAMASAIEAAGTAHAAAVVAVARKQAEIAKANAATSTSETFGMAIEQMGRIASNGG